MSPFTGGQCTWGRFVCPSSQRQTPIPAPTVILYSTSSRPTQNVKLAAFLFIKKAGIPRTSSCDCRLHSRKLCHFFLSPKFHSLFSPWSSFFVRFCLVRNIFVLIFGGGIRRSAGVLRASSPRMETVDNRVHYMHKYICVEILIRASGAVGSFLFHDQWRSKETSREHNIVDLHSPHIFNVTTLGPLPIPSRTLW